MGGGAGKGSKGILGPGRSDSALLDSRTKNMVVSWLDPTDLVIACHPETRAQKQYVRAAIKMLPAFSYMQGDLKNGYNEVECEGVLVNIKDDSGKLDDTTLAFSHALLLPEAHVGVGNGTSLTTAPCRCAEGVHQGAIEAGWFFLPLHVTLAPSSDSTIDLENMGAAGVIGLPSLMSIISWVHQNKSLLLMKSLLLTLQRLDSLLNLANQSANQCPPSPRQLG